MPELGPTLKVVQTSPFSLPFTLFLTERMHCAVFNVYLPPLLVFVSYSDHQCLQDSYFIQYKANADMTLQVHLNTLECNGKVNLFQ